MRRHQGSLVSNFTCGSVPISLWLPRARGVAALFACIQFTLRSCSFFCCRHYKRVSEERKNALELASRQQWMLMELEHERRKERDRSEKDEAHRARELEDQLRRVEQVKREKVRAPSHFCRSAALVRQRWGP